jgi:uncharacterized protein YutE (UPF0331/DUF86 family)
LVDHSLILRKVSELEDMHRQMGEFSPLTLEQYLSDWKTQRIVERTLQMMIELCSDVAGHIISDKGFRTPHSYADSFKVLAENRVIGAELLPVMEKMAKFRNVVVHQYDCVDAGIVMVILKKHLGDFLLFKDAVVGFVRAGSQ